MKKLLLFLISGCFLILGCTKKSTENVANKAGGAVQMVNPIKESSAQEILQKVGVEIGVPKDATNIRYSIISTSEGPTAQMDFDWKNSECTARIQPSGSLQLEDISGFYYNWQNEATCNVSYNVAQVKWTSTADGETPGICIWWDAVPGLMYSVSMKNNADEQSLCELANAVYIQMQGDAD